ncbi:hypothetical protein [Pseudonocardia sp.]|uniref:hypothetical protein n=1 Tax=Pseudonocardia sp. TaxID=60912 RepID=UPI0031FE2A7A
MANGTSTIVRPGQVGQEERAVVGADALDDAVMGEPEPRDQDEAQEERAEPAGLVGEHAGQIPAGVRPPSTSTNGRTSSVMAMATTASRKVTNLSSPRSVRIRAG